MSHSSRRGDASSTDPLRPVQPGTAAAVPGTCLEDSTDTTRTGCVIGEEARIEIPSQPVFLAPLRAFVSEFARRCGFDEHAQFQVALAVDEAVANVINHGYGRRPDGRIWLMVAPCGGRRGVRCVIEDLGRQVDPAAIRSRPLEEIRPGGLGVHIIREVMDECCYERRAGGGMRLTLVKYLDGPAGREAARRSQTGTRP